MGKEKAYLFMRKDEEILRFSVDFKRRDVKILEKKEGYFKGLGLYGMGKDEDTDAALFSKFFARRCIPMMRHGYEEILKATGCKDTFELSFQGHGLSLSNHYWFQEEGEHLSYKDINFFENRWDDAFGRALLYEDYETLSKCSYEVPDIVTPGWAMKGWVYEDGPKLCKLGIAPGRNEESLGEYLASRLAQRLFPKGEVLEYGLKQWGDRYLSVSSPIVGMEEELVPLSDVVPSDLYAMYRERGTDKETMRKFYESLSALGMPEVESLFHKVACLRSLAFVSDLHFDNLGILYNPEKKTLKAAPFFDLAGAFGGGKRGRDFLQELSPATLMIVFFIFGGLEPSWDYSWYDPKRLEGFEEEIRDTLSKSPFYTPVLLDNIIAVYLRQKASLDNIAMGK